MIIVTTEFGLLSRGKERAKMKENAILVLDETNELYWGKQCTWGSYKGFLLQQKVNHTDVFFFFIKEMNDNCLSLQSKQSGLGFVHHLWINRGEIEQRLVAFLLLAPLSETTQHSTACLMHSDTEAEGSAYQKCRLQWQCHLILRLKISFLKTSLQFRAASGKENLARKSQIYIQAAICVAVKNC